MGGGGGKFTCDDCETLYGALPEHLQPSCLNLDEALCCPKGVPQIHPRNHDAVFLLSLLSMHSVDSNTGLIRYSPDLAGDIFVLQRLEGEERTLNIVKVLAMIQVVNDQHLTARKKEMDKKGEDGSKS